MPALTTSKDTLRLFDFDQTIYVRDSSADFILFSCRRHPKVVLYLIGALPWVLGYALHLNSKTRMKQHLFSFLKCIDWEPEVALFWDTCARGRSVKRQDDLKSSVMEHLRPGDVIASASPVFLLEPMAAKLQVGLIASEVDPASGRFLSENCHDIEKGKRVQRDLLDANPGLVIEEFFSDSLSDEPCAQMAKTAYLVKGGELLPWPAKA